MVFVQRPSQGVSGAEQVRLQLPAMQAWDCGQRTPQAPQWLGSVVVSTQAPAQSVRPGGQAGRHMPPVQV
jgi:hypothetical protein